MADIIEIAGQFYVLAASTYGTVGAARVVKHANTFAVFDQYGDIRYLGLGEQGIYHHGTRYLSRYEISIQGERPLLLSSDVSRDNHLLAVDLTNPDLVYGEERIPRGTVHIFRGKFLYEGRSYEKYRLRSFAQKPLTLDLRVDFGADFADIFEVRGMQRRRRGERLEPVCSEAAVELIYQGVDGILRRTLLEFSPAPAQLREDGVDFAISLEPGQEQEIAVTVSFLSGESAEAPRAEYAEAYAASSRLLHEARGRECSVVTSSGRFNALIARAVSDLRMLLTETQGWLYPYAGIPWFSTPFGRDGLITAMETLWFNPDIGRGVLGYLAATQVDSSNDLQDAEPGKILHELRMGEMTNSGELPFARYYGSADSTPLFIMLAGAWLRRTGDLEYARRIWPSVERALEWIEKYGDRDGDGFVEYLRRSEHGIENQAWKDSYDSVFHEDGTLAVPPIAICEVQGYTYAALNEAAFLAEHLGNAELALELRARARKLRKLFEQAFWDERMGIYVLALDRDKKPCRVRASNMGHLLFTGIASPKRARQVADVLMSEAFFSGWGIRTIPVGEARYNPMSYHNGSIWPHDNALIAEGLARYGFKRQSARILEAMFQLSEYTSLHRFPELFCGFDRRPNQGPTLYPVACSPQAWSAGSILYLLKSCLGLSVEAVEKRITFDRPFLPEFLQRVEIRNLEIGRETIDFAAIRHERSVSIEVLERSAGLEIVTNL